VSPAIVQSNFGFCGLGLTALMGFCLMASQEWHEHQPRRINE
jgi:hypothetical protein